MTIDKKYQKYLDSPQWKSKRMRVLKRDKFRCQRCKKARATQVHHRTYIRLYKEKLKDLVAICKTCHEEIHGIKPEKKSLISNFIRNLYSDI